MSADLPVDDRPHAAAVRALIGAELAGREGPTPETQWKVFEYDQKPDKTVDKIHVVFTVSRRFGGNPRVGGGVSPTGWRITTRCVGRTVNEARFAMEAASGLERKRVVVDDKRSTPIKFELATPAEPDDGMFSGLLQWTYVL